MAEMTVKLVVRRRWWCRPAMALALMQCRVMSHFGVLDEDHIEALTDWFARHAFRLDVV